MKLKKSVDLSKYHSFLILHKETDSVEQVRIRKRLTLQEQESAKRYLNSLGDVIGAFKLKTNENTSNSRRLS